MSKGQNTAIIIGASLSGVIAAKAISELFEELIIIERGDENSVSAQTMQHLEGLSRLPGVHVLYNSSVRGFMSNTEAHITGAYVQAENRRGEIIHANTIIDASDNGSCTPLWIQGMGFEAISCAEKHIAISAPHTQIVTLQFFNYHKANVLPAGLYVIGDALTNIGRLAAREDKLANIQAVVLKKYLSKQDGNLKFQKNIAGIVSMLIQEYIQIAEKRIRVEAHLETRRESFAISHH